MKKKYYATPFSNCLYLLGLACTTFRIAQPHKAVSVKCMSTPNPGFDVI